MGQNSVKDEVLATYESRGSMTRKEVAEKFGWTESKLQYWLYGKRKSRTKEPSTSKALLKAKEHAKAVRQKALEAYDARGTKTAFDVAEEIGIKYWTLMDWVKIRKKAGKMASSSKAEKASLPAEPTPKSSALGPQLALPFTSESLEAQVKAKRFEADNALLRLRLQHARSLVAEVLAKIDNMVNETR